MYTHTYLSQFDQVCEHDDCGGVLFPDHSPEVLHSPIQWALCGDVLMSSGVALGGGEKRSVLLGLGIGGVELGLGLGVGGVELGIGLGLGVGGRWSRARARGRWSRARARGRWSRARARWSRARARGG